MEVRGNDREQRTESETDDGAFRGELDQEAQGLFSQSCAEGSHTWIRADALQKQVVVYTPLTEGEKGGKRWVWSVPVSSTSGSDTISGGSTHKHLPRGRFCRFLTPHGGSGNLLRRSGPEARVLQDFRCYRCLFWWRTSVCVTR